MERLDAVYRTCLSAKIPVFFVWRLALKERTFNGLID
ncbi:hypothetical protein EZ55_00115 [Alteromonas macleodii]|jgi:hypothetical protein|nr:hypothetical protein EZ55_00115 [Alteromonas macleodii]VTP51471.1 hypothetical protein EZ55_00115 [Alteromonas macleodii]